MRTLRAPEGAEPISAVKKQCDFLDHNIRRYVPIRKIWSHRICTRYDKQYAHVIYDNMFRYGDMFRYTEICSDIRDLSVMSLSMPLTMNASRCLPLTEPAHVCLARSMRSKYSFSRAGVHVQVQLLILPLRRHGNMLGRRARYGRLGNDMHFMHISTISCHITGHNRNSYELLKLPES